MVVLTLRPIHFMVLGCYFSLVGLDWPPVQAHLAIMYAHELSHLLAQPGNVDVRFWPIADVGAVPLLLIRSAVISLSGQSGSTRICRTFGQPSRGAASFSNLYLHD